jgi:hypothetical protein
LPGSAPFSPLLPCSWAWGPRLPLRRRRACGFGPMRRKPRRHRPHRLRRPGFGFGRMRSSPRRPPRPGCGFGRMRSSPRRSRRLGCGFGRMRSGPRRLLRPGCGFGLSRPVSRRSEQRRDSGSERRRGRLSPTAVPHKWPATCVAGHLAVPRPPGRGLSGWVAIVTEHNFAAEFLSIELSPCVAHHTKLGNRRRTPTAPKS